MTRRFGVATPAMQERTLPYPRHLPDPDEVICQSHARTYL